MFLLLETKVVSGFVYKPSYLNIEQQEEILCSIKENQDQAPFFIPRMPKTGRAFSVLMTNMGQYGWVSDRSGGYRYQSTHPETSKSWPDIPEFLMGLWSDIVDCTQLPEACLVNGYPAGAKMGLHKDQDEKDLSLPVLSVSIGNDALFRIGGLKRKDPTSSFRLASGDVVVLKDEARLSYHGIDKVYETGERELLQKYFPEFSRLNLTFRCVN